MKKVMISARLNAATNAAIHQFASDKGLNLTDVIAEAIAEYIERHKNDRYSVVRQIKAIPGKP